MDRFRMLYDTIQSLQIEWVGMGKLSTDPLNGVFSCERRNFPILNSVAAKNWRFTVDSVDIVWGKPPFCVIVEMQN